jgi:hypothetical protein
VSGAGSETSRRLAATITSSATTVIAAITLTVLLIVVSWTTISAIEVFLRLDSLRSCALCGNSRLLGSAVNLVRRLVGIALWNRNLSRRLSTYGLLASFVTLSAPTATATAATPATAAVSSWGTFANLLRRSLFGRFWAGKVLVCAGFSRFRSGVLASLRTIATTIATTAISVAIAIATVVA